MNYIFKRFTLLKNLIALDKHLISKWDSIAL